MQNCREESELMKLMESQDEMPVDFFREVLDNSSPLGIFEDNFNVMNKRSQLFQKACGDDAGFSQGRFQCKEEELVSEASVRKMEEQPKRRASPQLQYNQGSEKQKDSVLQQPKSQKDHLKENEKNKRTTRCSTRIQQQQDLSLNLWKPEASSFIADFGETHETNSNQSKNFSRGSKKLGRKLGKYIMKKKHFRKAFKISFPKKIVEMFVNHYEEYQVEGTEDGEEIRKYNDGLRDRLKQNKKNDYTFEKQVCQILGEGRDELQMEQNLARKISRANRVAFSEIIRETMKEEVIMRDKIAKNRELYMIQLKVYALRCRSHKLSKKGTFK